MDAMSKALDEAIEIIVNQDMTIQKQRSLIADLLELNRLRQLENNQWRFLHEIESRRGVSLEPSMN